MFSFVSRISLMKIANAVLFCAVASIAAVDAEMEGMEVDQRDDGTFLVGSPCNDTYKNVNFMYYLTYYWYFKWC